MSGSVRVQYPFRQEVVLPGVDPAGPPYRTAPHPHVNQPPPGVLGEVARNERVGAYGRNSASSRYSPRPQ
jgi:hypothetical protein